MRSEDLGLINTFTCLHHQEPVWWLPVELFSTDRAPPIVTPFSPRDPPDVVFKGKLLQCGHAFQLHAEELQNASCAAKTPHLEKHGFWIASSSLPGPPPHCQISAISKLTFGRSRKTRAMPKRLLGWQVRRRCGCGIVCVATGRTSRFGSPRTWPPFGSSPSPSCRHGGGTRQLRR